MMRLSRFVLLAAAAVAAGHTAHADYMPPPSYNLAGQSGAVVLGQIVAVDPTTFTLRIEEVLSGRVEGSTVVVVRFEDWTCSQRWKPYAVGQREVAFLDELPPVHEGAPDARYRLRSAGSEAEWETRGDLIAIMGAVVPGVEMSDNKERTAQWQWLPLQHVLDALRSYRQCFSVVADPANFWKSIVRVLCDESDVDTFRRRSAFHDYLAKTSLEAASK